MEIEPDLCPFCDSNALSFDVTGSVPEPDVAVLCLDCKSRGPSMRIFRDEAEHQYIDRAVAAWNRAATTRLNKPPRPPSPEGVFFDIEETLWGLANDCVHCGSTPTGLRFGLNTAPPNLEWGFVECGHCKSRGPLIDARGMTEVDDSWFPYAIAAWNKRTRGA